MEHPDLNGATGWIKQNSRLNSTTLATTAIHGSGRYQASDFRYRQNTVTVRRCHHEGAAMSPQSRRARYGRGIQRLIDDTHDISLA